MRSLLAAVKRLAIWTSSAGAASSARADWTAAAWADSDLGQGPLRRLDGFRFRGSLGLLGGDGLLRPAFRVLELGPQHRHQPLLVDRLRFRVRPLARPQLLRHVVHAGHRQARMQRLLPLAVSVELLAKRADAGLLRSGAGREGMRRHERYCPVGDLQDASLSNRPNE